MSDFVNTRQGMINTFQPHACTAAEFMRNLFWAYRKRGRNIWKGSMDFARLSDQIVTNQAPLHRPAYFTTENTYNNTEAIRYWFNPWCYVEFFDIREAEGGKAKIIASPAQIISKKVIEAGRTTLEHRADTEGTLSHSFSREEETEHVRELAVTASAEFRQLIKAGGEAASFSSETELTTSLETMASDTRRQLTKVGLTVEYEEPVKGRVSRLVEWLVELGKYRQKITIDGELDYGIRFWSHGDFTYTWLSRDEFISCINGIGDIGQANREGRNNAADLWNRNLPKAFGPMPDWKVDSIARPVVARVELERQFEKAYDQSFKVLDTPLVG